MKDKTNIHRTITTYNFWMPKDFHKKEKKKNTLEGVDNQIF